ncbi:gliding motility-associated-like protein [Flavobacterium chryseum]|uniref:gliding motility-associated C-terminal domain-containing protein n=1 Tax=Flavobacterium sp. P3160 TaxID=2512113 RepID=UPI001060F2F2|nr:gliding motility-associated C-terminal domain-containing protein [Flavobacterium sp. P3160]TDO69778.1 gliding motility-associated-like protein [Flavobacterium sp. P3160]
MIKKYYNFLQFLLFFVFLTSVSTKIYSQCAGNDATLTVCDYPNPANNSINLFSLLGGATPGGTWSDDGESGGLDPATGILNVHVITSSGFYNYTYTIDGIAGCADNSSTVTLILGGYTGKPAQAIICSSYETYNLFTPFDGSYLSPLFNGKWHNDTTNTDINGSIIDVKKLSGLYYFTYTMEAVGTCPAPNPATISIKVVRAPESGKANDPLKVCSDALPNFTNYDLFNMVTGADADGAWRDVNLRPTGELTFVGDHIIDLEKIYNRFGEGDYYFNYSVPSTDRVCSSAETRIRIRIERKLDFTGAKVTVNTDICETAIATATYSVRIEKGPAVIPNGNYYIEFNVSGPNGGSEKVTANLTNGVFLFPIKSDYFKQVGDFTVTILNIYSVNSERACVNTPNLSDVLYVYPLPDLSGAKIAETTTCQNSSPAIVISDAINIADGIYDLRYNISGANNANAQNIRVTFTGGNAKFQIPSFLTSQSGNAVITITNITSLISQCSNTANIKGDIIINPLPNIANLKIQINDYCFGDPVTASISGLGSLTDVTLSYVLSGKNTSAVQTIGLSPTNGNATFIIPSGLLINTGSTTATITNLMNNNTTCNVNVTGVADPFSLNPIPAPPITNDQSFCKSDGATIANLVPHGAQYKWYNSAAMTTPLADTYILQSENYYVTVTTLNCTSDPIMISVTINDIPAPELNSNGANFCGLNNPTIADLSINTNVPSTVVWYDAANNGNLLSSTTRLIEQGRYYGFDFSDTTNCLSNESLEVTVSLTDCDEVPNDFFIPDGFSPNGDGVNDTFVIPNIEFLYPNFTLEIFNRYGNGMYKGFINKPGWDGTNYETNGVASGVAPNGVYFYILNFNKDNKKPKQGRLYLNR